MHTCTYAGSLYQTNHIACRLSSLASVVYFSQVYRDSVWSSILVKSVRQTRFGHLFQSSMLDRLDQNRRPKSILVEFGKQTLPASLFQSSLHLCFAREFQSSLSRENCFTSLYISQVYSLQREKETCFACLFFEPISSLHKSILVQSKTGHIQTGRQAETQ